MIRQEMHELKLYKVLNEQTKAPRRNLIAGILEYHQRKLKMIKRDVIANLGGHVSITKDGMSAYKQTVLCKSINK